MLTIIFVMFYFSCCRGKFSGHQSMRMMLRKISTQKFLIVYLSFLEKLELLEKEHNGFLMMCGPGC